MIDQITVLNKQVKIILSGKIYVDEATLIREKVFPYIENGMIEFVINMSKVEYIDSSGLGVLVAIQKRVLQHSGGVTIEGLSGDVKELFELTSLNKVFNLR